MHSTVQIVSTLVSKRIVEVIVALVLEGWSKSQEEIIQKACVAQK